MSTIIRRRSPRNGLLAIWILDSYLGLAPTDWVAAQKAVAEQQEKEAAEVMKKQETIRAADSHPSLALEKYVGIYSDPWYGPVTIRVEGGRLVFTLDTHRKPSPTSNTGSTIRSKRIGATAPSKMRSSRSP